MVAGIAGTLLPSSIWFHPLPLCDICQTGINRQPSIAQLEERGTVKATDLSRGRWFEPGSKDVFDYPPNDHDGYDRQD